MRSKFALLATGILFSWGTLCAQSARRASPGFGRAWWTGASRLEREGFLNGYEDCQPDKAKANLPGWSHPIGDVVDEIDRYYRAEAGSKLGAAAVALEVAAKMAPYRELPGSEVYTSRHGYYDGLWWGGAGEQVGYVEGYMVCLGQPPTRKEAERLARAITAWYAQHPSRVDRPIADVLEDLLRARRKCAAQPRKSGTSKPGS